eukprot:403346662
MDVNRIHSESYRQFKSSTINQEDNILQKLVELKYALQKKGKITEEEYPSIKVLVRDVIGFRELNQQLRNKFINHIHFYEAKKDELIIKKDDSTVDMFIVLKGKIKVSVYPPDEVHKELNERENYDLISQINLFKVVRPTQIFGNFSCFHPDKAWKSVYAYAEGEDAEMIRLDYTNIKQLFDDQNEELKKLEMLAFLSDSIPGFRYRAKKEKFIKYFEKRSYKPGHVLIREGEKSDFAYIVKKGELRIISHQIPMVIGSIHKIKKPNHRTVVNTNGYFSQTLNSFQIGIIEEKQWAGDEILARKDEPFLYSIVCQTCVELLCISKADLTNSQKIHKDIQEQIKDKAQKKLEWVTKRFIDICIGVENISKWDNIYDEFKEKVSEAARKFPKANYQALISFINSLPVTKKSLDEVISQFQNNDNDQNFEKVKKHNQSQTNNFSQTLNFNQSVFSPNQSQMSIMKSQTTSPNIQKRIVIPSNNTITLSPSDYGGGNRPKTAIPNDNNQSYYGGFFNTQANFDKQIKDQTVRNSMMFLNKNDRMRESMQSIDFGMFDITQHQSFVIRPNTSGLMINQSRGNSSQQRSRPVGLPQNQTSLMNNTHQQQKNRSLLSSLINQGMSQSRVSLPPQNLVSIPTLKNLTQTPVQHKNPQKIAMESASTFIVSFDQKYSVPTFSKLQLAKRQNYEKIIKIRQEYKLNPLKRNENSEVLNKIKDGILEKHQTFQLNGKTIHVKSNKEAALKRQMTPNYVNEWANTNNIDLTQVSNPELARRKQLQKERNLKSQKDLQNILGSANGLPQNGGTNHVSIQNKVANKELQRRMTISLNKIHSMASLKKPNK